MNEYNMKKDRKLAYDLLSASTMISIEKKKQNKNLSTED